MRKDKDKLQSQGHSIRRHSFLFVLPLFLTLACLLAACGSNGGATTAGPTPTPAPTSSPTRVVNPSRADGCPNPAPTAPAEVKPNVVIKLNNSNRTVTAHNGDLIEVLLPSNEQWSGPKNSQGVLTLQTPSGYPLKAEKMCVWHFVAHGTGATTLTFSGRAICKAGQLCPMYIIEVPFRVEVK
jgi:hypothetical protein